MSKILSIDTSTKVCSVALHDKGELIGQQAYHLQKSHSSLLPVIIEQLLENGEASFSDLEAIALSAGPGSYTGLRIGTATAKGLAFSLEIPLIALDSLDSMIAQIAPFYPEHACLCPMIDARRMEVYCKVVGTSGAVYWQTAPVIIDEHTFSEFEGRQLVLFGNGSDKLKDFFHGTLMQFVPGIHPSAAHMGHLAYTMFLNGEFEDLAYFEPEYLKEYRTNTPSHKFKV